MAIIISSLNKLPEHCYDCPCSHSETGECEADTEHRTFSDWRPFWCPLKEERILFNEEQEE